MVLAIVVALGAASLVVLAVSVIALAKQTGRLAGSVAEFDRETRPILESIQSDAERAAERMEQLRPTDDS